MHPVMYGVVPRGFDVVHVFFPRFPFIVSYQACWLSSFVCSFQISFQRSSDSVSTLAILCTVLPEYDYIPATRISHLYANRLRIARLRRITDSPSGQEEQCNQRPAPHLRITTCNISMAISHRSQPIKLTDGSPPPDSSTPRPATLTCPSAPPSHQSARRN
jgi:hypothetical protein